MQPPHAEDLALARDVVSGSSDSWSGFVHRYSGLIFSVIRRYLYNEDEDEQRNVYVRILEDLYTRRLADYDGRSSLATWIVTIARSRSLDFLRSRYGRRSAPRWLDEVTAREKEIYTLHYIEGLGVREIVSRLTSDGVSLTDSEVADCLHALGSRMTRQLRTRLAYDLHARNGGSPLDALSDELHRAGAVATESNNPEYRLFVNEQQRMLDRLRTYVEQLESEERDVVRLCFDEGLTARETAERLGLVSARRTYTILARAIHHLRAAFDVPFHPGRNERNRPR